MDPVEPEAMEQVIFNEQECTSELTKARGDPSYCAYPGRLKRVNDQLEQVQTALVAKLQQLEQAEARLALLQTKISSENDAISNNLAALEGAIQQFASRQPAGAEQVIALSAQLDQIKQDLLQLQSLREREQNYTAFLAMLGNEIASLEQVAAELVGRPTAPSAPGPGPSVAQAAPRQVSFAPSAAGSTGAPRPSRFGRGRARAPATKTEPREQSPSRSGVGSKQQTPASQSQVPPTPASQTTLDELIALLQAPGVKQPTQAQAKQTGTIRPSNRPSAIAGPISNPAT